MKQRFPGIDKCLAMMRKRDPQVAEDGFHWLESRASEYLDRLVEEFRRETDHGVQCWLLEFIGHSKDPRAFELLAEQANSPDESLRDWAIRGLRDLDTKESRTLLYRMEAD